MLNLVLADKAKQIITLEDDILSIQTQRGKMLVSDTMSYSAHLRSHMDLFLMKSRRKSFSNYVVF